jgi:carbamoyl-phosphate synthase large subunit
VIAECGFPVVAKPRRGKGSAGVSVVETREELAVFLGRPDYVIEQRLGDDSAEFTVGCFSDREGQVRGAIAMRRELVHGTTSRAIVGDFPAIREEAVRIASRLKPIGPCNVQLRLHEGTATCFEINVRFSGTTAMRARFGFNDVEAALRHYVLDEPAVDLPAVTEGIAVRYWNELYVDGAASAALEASGRLEDGRHTSDVEDYGRKR